MDEIIGGDYTQPLAVMKGRLAPDGFSIGTLFSTLCAQVIFDRSTVASVSALPIHPALIVRELSAYESLDRICERWHTGNTTRVHITNQLIDIPVLVLAGEFDIRTPSADAQEVSGMLDNSYFVEIPRGGHGVLGDRCAREMRIEFLSDPSAQPSTQCVDEVTAFILSKSILQLPKERNLQEGQFRWPYIR